MKAWQYEQEKRRNAIPVDFKEEESDWSGFNEMQAARDKMLAMLWDSKVPGSRAPESLYIEMVQAWSNRGYNVQEAEALIPRGIQACKDKNYRRLEVISARLRKALREAPINDNHSYWSYDNPVNWNEIKAAMPYPEPFAEPKLSAKDLERKVLGGWYGQIAGGAYGTALEGYTGEAINEVYGDKLNYYVREPETYNDDITFQIAFLAALEGRGKDLTADEIADKWLELIPFGWSAEYIALENFKKGLYPPLSGNFDNFFSEWIGAQMRGMVCGFVAPGKPMQAARFAYLDGIVSHEKNGVYGEIHSAVMTALAFVYQDTKTILEKSAAYLPVNSEFYYFMQLAMENAIKEEDHRTAWQATAEQLKKYNWIHTYPNLVAVVYSLYYCDNSFEKAMRILADCGMDVDCNAGEVGSIIGVMNPSAIPSKWTEPFADRLQTYLPGFEDISIKWLAEWTRRVTPVD